ncbi:uncharacterized protein LOC143246956 isoform X2 [Tachypleus tridentatus]|uniref:uncharacterized protein LOC143246956 isoform X2 n=1 Tax=Tachypleus tridentatus TaxID=6853 RepID=UPI003FCF0102
MLFAAVFLGLLACSQAGYLSGYGAGVIAPAAVAAPAYAAGYGGPDPTGAVGAAQGVVAAAQGAAAAREGAILRGVPVGRAAASTSNVNHGGAAFGLGHGLGFGYGLGGALGYGYGLGGALGYGYGLGGALGLGHGLGFGYGYGLGGVYGLNGYYGAGLGKGLLH